jgi:synaptojanin
LWRRRKPVPDALIYPNWNPGKLVHYGRSELKQSDHRPVIAIVDIEISVIQSDKRSKVFKDVVSDLGPPDATIIIQVSKSN